jgi:hypothetical protein
MALGRLSLGYPLDPSSSTTDRDPDCDAEVGNPTFFLPKERALPAALRDRGLVSGIGGALVRYGPFTLEKKFSSNGMSVDDGNVEVEL